VAFYVRFYIPIASSHFLAYNTATSWCVAFSARLDNYNANSIFKVSAYDS